MRTHTQQTLRGSAVMQQRCHVGLQELVALATATASLLGPCKASKLVQGEGGEAVLVSSCVRLLELAEPPAPGAAGQLAAEAVHAQHRALHTGAAGLLAVAGAWGGAALESLQQGVPLPHVAAAMARGLDACLDACRSLSVPLQDLLPAASPGARRHGDGKRLACSRHLCRARPDTLGAAATAVSHGCPDAMAMVVCAARLQSDGGGTAEFDVAKVTTCLLPGVPEEHSGVAPGVLVLLEASRAALARSLEGRPLNVAVLDGDLRRDHAHPGGAQRVARRLGAGGAEDVLQALRELQVHVVLLRGVAGEGVAWHCAGGGVLVVQQLPGRVLRALARAAGAVPVARARQLSRLCVGAGLRLQVRPDPPGPGLAVCLSAAAAPGLATALLASRVPAALQALEDRFWGCAHRLHHALSDGALLPGGGAIEALCARRLRRLAGGGGDRRGAHEGVVLGLMADGLLDYVCTLVANGGTRTRLEARTALARLLDGPRDPSAPQLSALLGGWAAGEQGEEVWDNLRVKMEVWRRALDLVLLVLQTDAEVITGVDPDGMGLQDALTLL